MNRTVRILCALAAGAAAFSVSVISGEPTWESEPAHTVIAGEPTWESEPTHAVIAGEPTWETGPGGVVTTGTDELTWEIAPVDADPGA
ncbi:hypothetical protein [Streptomyces sp. NPDC003023]|uniref:hypothetical protein n=1 Tax=Streptomyces sp. NPDC003023 TaxID=3364675 RepID=UPI0036C4CB13